MGEGSEGRRRTDGTVDGSREDDETEEVTSFEGFDDPGTKTRMERKGSVQPDASSFEGDPEKRRGFYTHLLVTTR